MLRMFELDSSVIPGMKKNQWEVYEDNDITGAIFITDSLDTAVKFCYDSGQNFEVNTLEAYYKEYGDY